MSNDTQVQAHMALVDQYMATTQNGYGGAFGNPAQARAAVEASARQLAEQGAPLTLEQLAKLLVSVGADPDSDKTDFALEFARAIEAHHGIAARASKGTP